MRNKILFPISCYIAVIGIFTLLVARYLFSEGMFMDGLIYATTSRNMAEGTGSFWYPQFTESVLHHFHQHPPMALWLESLYFRVIGDSIYVERIYSYTTFLVTALIIGAIWKEITGTWKTGWLPILFWILLPMVRWAYANNMLENTMGVFICFSVWSYLKSQKNNSFLFLSLSGLSLFLGLLTKGFVSLFPWSFPFITWLVMKKGTVRSMIRESTILIGATLLPVVLLFIFSHSAADSMLKYIDSQLVASLEKIRIVGSRSFIVIQFFKEIMYLVFFTGILLLLVYFTKKRKSPGGMVSEVRLSLQFFLLSLTGVVPIMITLKQYKFYIAPVYPFVAIALAILIYPAIREYLEKAASRLSMAIPAVLLSLGLLSAGIWVSMEQKGKIRTEYEQIYDTRAITQVVGRNTIISKNKDFRTEWVMMAYLARYSKISVEFRDVKEYPLLIVNKNTTWKDSANEFEKVNIQTLKYDLYRRRAAGTNE